MNYEVVLKRNVQGIKSTLRIIQEADDQDEAATIVQLMYPSWNVTYVTHHWTYPTVE